MQFKDTFNAAKYVEEHGLADGDIEPLEPGLYDAQIESVGREKTKNGAGKQFVTILSIHLDNGRTRRVYDRCLFQHATSAVAVEIQMRRFASMCVAAGIPELQNTDQLVGKWVVVALKINGNYNEVVGYQPSRFNQQQPQQHQQPQQPQPQQPQQQDHPDMDDDLPF